MLQSFVKNESGRRQKMQVGEILKCTDHRLQRSLKKLSNQIEIQTQFQKEGKTKLNSNSKNAKVQLRNHKTI